MSFVRNLSIRLRLALAFLLMVALLIANGLSGLLSAPDGHVQDVRFERRADGSFAARVQPDPAHAGGFGLWEIHAFGNALSGGLDVARDARDAFAVSVATARLDGAIERIPSAGKDTGVQLRIGIESAVASRYQLYLPTEEELQRELEREREEAEQALRLHAGEAEEPEG